jgi:DNA-directed RNA polymerase-3 subunit RPC5
MEGDDEVVGVMPIHYTNTLAQNVTVLQFPLLTRPLEIPPSAAASGKRIKARIKPNVRKLEVHVPTDIRPEVWNKERAAVLGVARLEDDKENSQESKMKQREGEQPRLSEVRLSSEEIPRTGTYMMGVVRNGMPSSVVARIVFKKTSRKAVPAPHCRGSPTASDVDIYGPPL